MSVGCFVSQNRFALNRHFPDHYHRGPAPVDAQIELISVVSMTETVRVG